MQLNEYFGDWLRVIDLKELNKVVMKVNHPAYYARTNTKMPPSIFREFNKLIKNKYGVPIKWYSELLI